MLYKEYLARIGQPLDQEAEKRRAERRKERNQNPKPFSEQPESDGEDDKEEEPELIKWELEWWRKPGAVIIS